MEAVAFEEFVGKILDGGQLGCPIQLKECPTEAQFDEAEARIFEDLGLVVVIDVGSNNVATACQV